MSTQPDRSIQIYKVVMDPHGYPFVRPAGEPLPMGWHEVGSRGTHDECLGFIREVEAESPPTFPSHISEEKSYPE